VVKVNPRPLSICSYQEVDDFFLYICCHFLSFLSNLLFDKFYDHQFILGDPYLHILSFQLKSCVGYQYIQVLIILQIPLYILSRQKHAEAKKNYRVNFYWYDHLSYDLVNDHIRFQMAFLRQQYQVSIFLLVSLNYEFVYQDTSRVTVLMLLRYRD